jgi:hypothetical protein
MMSKKRIEQLRDQLKWLQSRHDSSAVNTALGLTESRDDAEAKAEASST